MRARKQAIRREQVVDANTNELKNSRVSKFSTMAIGLGLMSVCAIVRRYERGDCGLWTRDCGL